MPSLTSHSKLLRDWEALLAAVEVNAGSLPFIEPLRAELERHLAEAKLLKTRQQSARAERQRLTQMVEEVFADGREVMMHLRQGILAQLGLRNERLVEFGIAPLRARSSRAIKPVAVQAAAPAAPVTPEGDVSPTGV